MKPIKLTIENAALIIDALRAVNGRSSAHTFTLPGELFCLVTQAESEISALDIPKKEWTGAVYIGQSGEVLPNAYQYAAQTTTVTIERRSSAWYLTDVRKSGLYSRQKPTRRLALTKSQSDAAHAALAKKFIVLAAA